VSRSYRWQMHDGRAPVPMTVIGTDAGLVPKPQIVTEIRHGMAERYEVIIDFSAYRGASITMKNLLPANNVNYDGIKQAMQFRVARTDPVNTVDNTIPAGWQDLVPAAECMTFNETDLKAQSVPQRRMDFIRTNSKWTINGETWEDVIDSDYTHCMAEVEKGAVEIWELRNSSGGWFHPVHIHLVDFQVLSRTLVAPERIGDVPKGLSGVQPWEKGPKDVVYVGEGEVVRVAMRFAGPPAGPGWPEPQGRYMMHCHNLVHEDHDMMMQFGVGDSDHTWEFDPIKAAKPVAIS
jgi:FtsP/CotA-like multicopper oxidase with cupredoxin domain